MRLGQVDADAAAVQLLKQVEQQFIQEGRAAIATQGERSWPFIHNQEALYVQKTATSLLGRTLTLYEIDDLMYRTQGNRDAILTDLQARADSRLFVYTKHLYEQMLERNERGVPILNREVEELIREQMAGQPLGALNQDAIQTLAGQIQARIQNSDEYHQLHASLNAFEASPLSPMPAIFKDFGVPVDYQVGGHHTGLDVANPRLPDGSEPPIFAVSDGTIVHVGPLYCDAPHACRGGNAIVIDHGNNIYSLYSHNSIAEVHEGDHVEAGQRIGLQGNDGYSFGSHLHFEVHVGAPFTDNWEKPFDAGEFVDPAPWLPKP